MARQILQQCLTCQAFSLSTKCPKCGERAQAAAPLKWSPEDHRASLRRKMNGVEDSAWSETLPTLPSLSAMIERSEEE
ncbi:MAG TPA: nucleolar RNA-binding Nop10p family protein [Poseidonia sp.]|nr:nucleolar RNA-binding Nop10p family protein [Poseidonia sp.]